jgi:hypothetical protein
MALGDSGLGRDVLEAQLLLLTRRAQPVTDRWNVRFDQLFVHSLAFDLSGLFLIEGWRRAVNRR